MTEITKEINGATVKATLLRQLHVGKDDQVALQLYSFEDAYYVGMTGIESEAESLQLFSSAGYPDALEAYRTIHIGIRC